MGLGSFRQKVAKVAKLGLEGWRVGFLTAALRDRQKGTKSTKIWAEGWMEGFKQEVRRGRSLGWMNLVLVLNRRLQRITKSSWIFDAFLPLVIVEEDARGPSVWIRGFRGV